MRLEAVDKEWVGSEHYMGLAYFWHYDFRFDLRDATAKQRCRVHDARSFLPGWTSTGFSQRHVEVVESILGSSAARELVS